MMAEIFQVGGRGVEIRHIIICGIVPIVRKNPERF